MEGLCPSSVPVCVFLCFLNEDKAHLLACPWAVKTEANQAVWMGPGRGRSWHGAQRGRGERGLVATCRG